MFTILRSHFFSLVINKLRVAYHIAWFCFKLLRRERNPSTFSIKVNDHYLHFVIYIKDVVRCLDMLVRNFRNVEQATDTTDVNKCTVWFDTTNHTNHNFANFELVHLALNEGPTMAEDETITIFIHF